MTNIDFYVCVCAQSLQLRLALCDPMDYSPSDLSVVGFRRQEHWVDFHAVLQGIFPTEGLNPHLLCLLQVDSLLLSHQGSLHVSKTWWKQVLIENYMQFCPVIWIFTFANYYVLWGRRWWHPTPVLLPGKSHGQRSLVDCSPWGLGESDTTEWLHFSLFTFMRWGRKWQPTPVFLPGES